MDSTQNHLPIEDIKNDVLILNDGSMAVVIQTSAVNFGLLSENEQLAIISAFAAMLNSLSFMIQILIRSKRLDISAYLKLLDEALVKQPNPLLAQMMVRYRNFIENTIRENEVLDKQFYIVIPVSYLELGLTKSSDDKFQKAMTVLMPRRDHIIRQLARIGLKATQLKTKELVTLFYDIYNEQSQLDQAPLEENQSDTQPTAQQKVTPPSSQTTTPPPVAAPNANTFLDNPVLQVLPTTPVNAALTNQPVAPQPIQPSAPAPQPSQPVYRQGNSPFVVEELKDDYHPVGR